MSQTIDLGKVVPVKGVDYWTPSEAAEMENAKDVAASAASNATTAANNANNAAESVTSAIETERAKVTSAISDLTEKKEECDTASANANDKATLANNAATNATAAAAVASKATKEMEEQASADHTQATSDHSTALSDHLTAGTDHTQAGSDHSQATSDHSNYKTDHSTATTDHTTAQTDTTQAASDHTQATTDHTTAESDHSQLDSYAKQAAADHTLAASDHTTAVADNSTAESDHTTATTDHTQAESDHQVVQGYDNRLTTAETNINTNTTNIAKNTGDITDLSQKVSTKADETDLAPLFDETKEYTYGDLVTYEGELWMCHAATGHTGAWVESDFVQKSLADILPSYCRKDGLYPNLTAGLALGLVGSEDAKTPKNVLAYQFSSEDNLSPYSSEVPSMSIKGRSIAWRQMVDNNNSESSEGTGSDGPTIGGTYVYSGTKTKPYLMHAQTADGVWEWRVVLVATEQTFAAAAASAFGYAQTVVADTETVLGSKCIDLVLAFGVTECSAWGDVSVTNLKKVAQLWGFASFADFAGGTATDGTTLINTQWEYLTTYKAEGELISTKIPAVIRSYDSAGNLVAEREVPEAVLQAFPDGYLRQAGSVCDEINETECVKRVGVYEFTGEDSGLSFSNFLNFSGIQTAKWTPTHCAALCNLYYWSIEPWHERVGYGYYNGMAPGGFILYDPKYTSLQSWKDYLKSLYDAGTPLVVFYELATPITTELSTPLSLAVLDSTTLLKFEPTDTEEPYAPAQLDMSIDRDYAAIVKQLAINAGIWN